MEIQNFDKLYARHFREIQRFCFLKLGNIEDAEDASDEIFVIAYQKFDPSRNAGFRTFIYHIATHYCIDLLRSKKIRNQHKTIPLEDITQTLIAEIRQTEIEDQEVLSALFNCLQRLKLEERIAIEHYYLQKFTLEEIAEILDKSIGTVRNRLESGRKKLKTCLEKNQVID